MIRKEDIVRAIHRGVLQAHKQFAGLSGGDWMADRDIPRLEGFVVSHIFRTISTHRSMKSHPTPILELPFSYISEWTGASPRGRPRKNTGPLRRVDIALLSRQEKPIHVVEVKQKWSKKTGLADVEKLGTILSDFGPNRRGTLKSVFLSVYWQSTIRPCLDERIDNVEEEVRKLLRPMEAIVRPSFHRKVHAPVKRKKDDKDWEYGSHIIELSRRNKKKE